MVPINSDPVTEYYAAADAVATRLCYYTNSVVHHHMPWTHGCGTDQMSEFGRFNETDTQTTRTQHGGYRMQGMHGGGQCSDLMNEHRIF